jgi:hypothetical protein
MSRRVRPRPFLIEFEFLRISHLLTRKHDIGGHEFSLSSIVTPAVRGHAVSDNVREVPKTRAIRSFLAKTSPRAWTHNHGNPRDKAALQRSLPKRRVIDYIWLNLTWHHVNPFAISIVVLSTVVGV